MTTVAGMPKPRQISRDFHGSLPQVGAIAFVAHIVREGLESAKYPDFGNLTALSDEYLVQEATLVAAVPNDVWIRNGFYPLSEWGPAPPE
jgi:hypothetical protein